MDNTTKDSVFLYIRGDDDSFAVEQFQDEFNEITVYEDMVKDEKSEETLISKNGDNIYVSIKRFGAVDDNFEDFIKDQLCDYDVLKQQDIIRVK